MSLSHAVTPGILSAKVIDLDTNEVILEQNADYPLVPASNQKIITLYASLKYLENGFRFKTTFSHDGYIDNKVLKGNLYIKFDGDPNLTQNDIIEVFEFIKAQGINKVLKGVIIDSTGYAENDYGEGLAVDQLVFCHHSPISSVIVNRNCQIAELEIGKRNKLLVKDKTSLHVNIINKAIYAEKDEGCKLDLKYQYLNNYSLEGTYSKSCDKLKLFIAVRDIKEYSKSVISRALEKSGIKHGWISFGRTPTVSKEVYSIYSQPLEYLLYRMTADSDNIIADSLFRKISQNKSTIGSSRESVKIYEKMINMELGEDKNSFRIADGAGGSRKNLVSANLLTKLLTSAYHNNSIKHKFISSFPIGGKEGTISERFQNLNKENIILAKTGTLENVSSLSGYIFKPGRKYAFSIIQNGVIASKNNVIVQEDEIINYILSHNDN